MSRKANCWDNAVAENFFGLIKREILNHFHFETRSHAELVIFDYINGWYNPNRIHSKLGYLSPNEFEAVNLSHTETNLNSVKCRKKPQLLVKVNESCGSNVLREAVQVLWYDAELWLNKIVDINSNDFKANTLLTKIILSTNKITAIASDAFDSLSKDSEIQLWLNDFTAEQITTLTQAFQVRDSGPIPLFANPDDDSYHGAVAEDASVTADLEANTDAESAGETSVEVPENPHEDYEKPHKDYKNPRED